MGRGWGLREETGTAPYCSPRFSIFASPGPENPLEGFPGHEVEKDFLRIKNEKPAVGLLKRSGDNLSEIGVQVSLAAFIFNLPGKIVICRICLPYDGRTVFRIVAHEDVHRVPGEVYVGVFVFCGRDEDAEVVYDVFGQVVDP